MNTSNKSTVNASIQVKGKNGEWYVLSCDGLPKGYNEEKFTLGDMKGRTKAAHHIRNLGSLKLTNLDIGNVDIDNIVYQPFNLPRKAQPVAAVAESTFITATSKILGWTINGYKLDLVDPGAADQTLKAHFDEELNSIRIQLATDSSGDITSTASLVKTALEADDYLDSKFTFSYTGAEAGTSVVAAQSVEFEGGYSSQYYIVYNGASEPNDAGDFRKIDVEADEHPEPIII